jgi:quercetin dioxygenase-like cupin family protein
MRDATGNLPRRAARVFVFLALAGGVGAALAAQGAQGAQQRVTPGEVKWPAGASSLTGTSGVSGIQTVTLKGDPTRAGLYTLLLRVGPNTRIEAHAHPDDRVATVVSGTWYFGYGSQFDEMALKELPAGSFYTEPPGMNHFALTKGEGVVIQISGTGPSGTVYADPRNDPTKRP